MSTAGRKTTRDYYAAGRARFALLKDGYTPEVQHTMIVKMEQAIALLEQRNRESRDNGGICATGQHEFKRIEPTAGYDYGCVNCGLGVQDDE